MLGFGRRGSVLENRCKRCRLLLAVDNDESWCLGCGMQETPFRASDPVMSNVTRRNRRLWNADEDMRILILAPNWDKLQQELHRPVHLLQARWEEIRR